MRKLIEIFSLRNYVYIQSGYIFIEKNGNVTVFNVEGRLNTNIVHYNREEEEEKKAPTKKLNQQQSHPEPINRSVTYQKTAVLKNDGKNQ